jgi:hypothetical protein
MGSDDESNGSTFVERSRGRGKKEKGGSEDRRE